MTRPTAEDQAQAHAVARHARRLKRTAFQNRARTYYHATPESNLPSIRQHGLLIRYSQGRVPAIWLCTRALIPWAVRHVQRRHNTNAVAVVVVQVPRRACVRFGHGRWFVQEDIGPQDITF